MAKQSDAPKGVKYTEMVLRTQTMSQTGEYWYSVETHLASVVFQSYLRRKSKQICIQVVLPSTHFYGVPMKILITPYLLVP